MKKLIALFLAIIGLSLTVVLTSCDGKNQEGNGGTAKGTVTEGEWEAALAKENFYNVTLDYAQYSFSDNTQETSKSEDVFQYDGDWMSVSGRVVANDGDMDTDEVSNMIGFGMNHYSDAAYDEEADHYFVKVYNDYYEMDFGLILRFEDGKLVRFELHFLDDGTTACMYKTRWHVFDFSDYGTTVVE